MVHHHKPNRAVEGDPGTGHGRGMPMRPDDDALAARAAVDRRELGLATEADLASVRGGAAARYGDLEAEMDRQVALGEIPADAGIPRKGRAPFPPTRYDG
ncbi:hypothetical protein AB0C59_19770 [Streptomyces sp. NPDC048664]|uniref:hypothetical protein n=1 Tax=Streptomyces sp. NPDC048664 TaxID=3154505 RepID=UPI003445A95D